MNSADQLEINDAFERGRAVGRVEGLAFEGVARIIPWTRGAQFDSSAVGFCPTSTTNARCSRSCAVCSGHVRMRGRRCAMISFA